MSTWALPVDSTGGGRNDLTSPTGPTPPSLATPPGNPNNPATPTLPSIPNPLGGIEDVAKVIAAIGQSILNPKMWRSLGWLLLGLGIMFFGVGLWLKHPLEDAVGTTVGAALKAP